MRTIDELCHFLRVAKLSPLEVPWEIRLYKGDFGAKPTGSLSPPLIEIAIQQGHLPTVQWLLEHGVDSNQRCLYQRTPLMVAAYEGQSEIVELLLTQGADVTLPDENDNTVLYWALSTSKKTWYAERIIRLLLDNNAKLEMNFKKKGAPLSPRYLEDKDIKAILEYYETNPPPKKTSIMLAAKWGNLERLRHLVERGFDINQQDANGWTALHWAVFSEEKNRVQTIALLLELGADTVKQNSAGQTFTALARALQRPISREGKLEELLIQHIANLAASQKPKAVQFSGSPPPPRKDTADSETKKVDPKLTTATLG